MHGQHSFFRGWFIGVLLVVCLADLHLRRNIRVDKSPVWPCAIDRVDFCLQVLHMEPCSNSVCSLTFSELYLNHSVCG